MSSNALLWPSQGTKPEERLDKHKWLRLPSQGVGGIAIPIISGDPILAIYPPIADATFQFYKFYQIKKNQIPSVQANKPLVIIDTLGAGIIQETSGFDIRVFDSSGTPIPYEVIEVTPGTGDFIVWINMAVVQDSEFVQLTFGKPSATDGSTPNTVYDVDYTSVYHLNGVGTDSTSNAENMTLNGVTTVPAKIGNGLNFTGTVNDFAIRNPYNSFPTTEITCEYWVQTSTTGDGMVSYAIDNTIPGSNHFLLFGQDALQVILQGIPAFTGQSFNDGTFHRITITWQSSDGQLLVYDGKTVIFSSIIQQGASFINGGAFVLGQEQDSLGGGFDPSQALDGIMEELKLSNTVRSADNIATSFNNEDDNDAFWFKTPVLENGEDNFLVDDMNRNIVAVQT